tara:strand:- start:2559 stop:3728 length:1170 start_codon:yes stop_codon:yes gene_type:complete
MQVSSGNLPIPNDTGANVLADMNENILALQSNNSGDSAPSVAKAHQTWIDTSGTVDVLKIKGDTDNAAFITLGNLETNLGMIPKTGGTFTGNVQSSAGTKASPSIQVNDANTGLYKPASDTIGLSCGGEDIAYVETTGIEIKDGKKLEFRDSGNSNVVSLQAPALTSDVTLTLPSDDGNADEVLTTNGNGVLSFQAVQGVPTGTIFPFAGAETDIPGGYLECDGDHVSSSTYSDLAAVCGNTYNKGQTPPSGEFFLPDLRGEFIRGWDHGRNKDTNRVRGSTQDTANLSHTHTVASSSISNSGGNHAHNIRPIRLNQHNGAVNITLGSGQSYNVGYANNDSGLVAANNAVKNSGNIGHLITSTLSLSLNSNGHNESRPHNVAMIYIIKT